MKKWTIEDSKETYNIKGWGVNFFGVNEKGHVYVSPKKDNVQVDLKELVDELATAHVVGIPWHCDRNGDGIRQYPRGRRHQCHHC